jgi:hypothetical protein
VRLERLDKAAVTSLQSDIQTCRPGTELARLQSLLVLYDGFFMQMMDRKVQFNIERAQLADFLILSPASSPAIF